MLFRHGRGVTLTPEGELFAERAGLRQVDLAERLDRPQSFVSNYERGQRRLDLVELDAICTALGVSVVTLVRRWSDGKVGSLDCD